MLLDKSVSRLITGTQSLFSVKSTNRVDLLCVRDDADAAATHRHGVDERPLVARRAVHLRGVQTLVSVETAADKQMS